MFHAKGARRKGDFPCAPPSGAKGTAAMKMTGNAGRMMMRKMGMLFVLWLVKKKQMKAYDAMRMMRDDGIPFATANRIYPLFAHMEKGGLVKGKKIPRDKRGAKEYSITDKGEALLRECRKRFCGGLMGEYLRDMVK